MICVASVATTWLPFATSSKRSAIRLAYYGKQKDYVSLAFQRRSSLHFVHIQTM